MTVNGPDVRDLGHQTRGPRAAFVLIYMLMGRTMVLCIFAVLCCPWFLCPAGTLKDDNTHLQLISLAGGATLQCG